MFFIYLFFIGIVWVILVFINDLVKIIKKEDSKYLGILLTMLSLSFIGLITFWFLQNIGNPFDFSSLSKEETPRAALGALGDYFGGLLNPLFAFLSFIALLYTLKLNQEELAETRKELARAAQAHEDSKKVMDEQLQTQELQRFDSFFATLLSELSRKIENLYPNKIKELEGRIFEFHGSNESKRKLVMQDREFSVFSIFLYQILKNIDEHIDADVDKRRYTNIVRSLIPEKILQILMINCYVEIEHHNFHRYKKLIEKFSFFEHIDFYDRKNILKASILLSTSTYYNANAFGENQAYRDFSESVVFESLKDKNNVNHIVYNMAKDSVNLLMRNIHYPKWGEVKLYSFRLRDKDDTPEISIVFPIKAQKYVEIRIQNRPIDQFYIRKDSIFFKTSDYPNGLNFQIQTGKDGKPIFTSDTIFESLRD